jgi:hypothetical protein
MRIRKELLSCAPESQGDKPNALTAPTEFRVARALALSENLNPARPTVQNRPRARPAARCVRFHLASSWPFQELFRSAVSSVNRA